nr:MAK10-like protein [Tanacetum cinerariifolium]
MGDEISNRPRTLRDYSRPSHEGYRNAIELPKGAKVSALRFDTVQLVQNECAFHGLREKVAWETIENLAQYEGEWWNNIIFPNKGSPDYIDANLKQELEGMKCRVESLMRSKVLLYYEEDLHFPKDLIMRSLREGY